LGDTYLTIRYYGKSKEGLSGLPYQDLVEKNLDLNTFTGQFLGVQIKEKQYQEY
jgi:hypothetical protein